MREIKKKVALITGASSGIGKAIYIQLIKQDWIVYGTSRKIKEKQTEKIDGGLMIYLDVNNQQSIDDVLSIVKDKQGRLDALINNAGYGIAGSIEDTSHEEAMAQFDTNFFGVLSMIQASLELLKRSKGIIVNISSVAGILSIPFQGMYSASKAAMELMSEAVRMELKDDGVRVSIVEPGDTKTEFTANRQMIENAYTAGYEKKLRASVARMEKDEQNGTPPEAVAKMVCRLIKRKNPPMRRSVGFSYQVLLFLKRILPNRLVLWVIGKMYA
ncbi:MAG: SDR family oxidoreductase [Clostridiales bacterium]|nr:SDR family oxidoreductase [Clostridiales bacterium]